MRRPLNVLLLSPVRPVGERGKAAFRARSVGERALVLRKIAWGDGYPFRGSVRAVFHRGAHWEVRRRRAVTESVLCVMGRENVPNVRGLAGSRSIARSVKGRERFGMRRQRRRFSIVCLRMRFVFFLLRCLLHRRLPRGRDALRKRIKKLRRAMGLFRMQKSGTMRVLLCWRPLVLRDFA